MITTRRPCNPMLHSSYTPLLNDRQALTPVDVAEVVRALVARRSTAPEEELEAIDAEIVDRTYWYVLRPDAIARALIGSRRHIITRRDERSER